MFILASLHFAHIINIIYILYIIFYRKTSYKTQCPRNLFFSFSFLLNLQQIKEMNKQLQEQTLKEKLYRLMIFVFTADIYIGHLFTYYHKKQSLISQQEQQFSSVEH